MSVATLLRTATGSGVPAFRPARLPGLATAKEWAEGGRLTLAAVAAAHRGAMTVKRSPDPHFMYTEVGVPDRLPDDAVTGVGARTEFVDMEPAEFVRACEKQDGSTPPFHYYTCGVLQHAPDFAEKACAGWQHLVAEERASAHRHATPPHSSLWLGGRGSTTQAHYDVLHNVFVQVHGRKRFRLWGPDAHAALRVFPDAHPRARKAQVLIDSDPGVPKAELDVTLEAGEALFVPAFWFHHVEALSPSVSVNVFSENSMKLAAQTILMQPAPDTLMQAATQASRPFEAAADQLSKMILLFHEHINLDPSLVSTVAQRYAPLAAASADGTHVKSDVSLAKEAAGRAASLEYDGKTRAEAQHLALLFRELQASVADCEGRHQQGLQEIIAAHVMEAWALSAVGAVNAGRLLAQTASLVSARLNVGHGSQR